MYAPIIINNCMQLIEITDEAFKRIIPDLKVGAVEKDISAKLSSDITKQ